MESGTSTTNPTADMESVAGFVMSAESAPGMPDRVQTIIKASFRCPEAKYFGAFILILPDTAEAKPSLCQVIGNNNLYGALAPEMPWRELSKHILNFRYQAAALSHNAMAGLERSLLHDTGCDILQRSADLGGEPLQQLLRNLLAEILADRGCELTVAVEYSCTGEAPGLPAAAAQAAESRLRIRFLIDPLNGIPAHRLKTGDRVAVHIQSAEAADRALVDQYQPRDKTGRPLPVIATITGITGREDDAMEIIVALGDRVKGGAVISKALRLRRGDEPAMAPAAKQNESAPAATPLVLSRELLLVIYGGLIAFFLLLLFFLISHWR